MSSAQPPFADPRRIAASTNPPATWQEVSHWAQPWPLCWEMMQWQISQTLWRRHKYQETLTVEVIWSEGLLQDQVAPDAFRLACADYHHVLSQQLGERLIWRFEQAPHRTHQVRIEHP